MKKYFIRLFVLVLSIGLLLLLSGVTMASSENEEDEVNCVCEEEACATQKWYSNWETGTGTPPLTMTKTTNNATCGFRGTVYRVDGVGNPGGTWIALYEGWLPHWMCLSP